ncbi:MAG: 16S rRNA (cytidine(1402)-2'-O)-methyltransferase, partial [Prolixibacteraceae bacterium]|nr:16S rRNA (cytidine(1402)-2'-O)-methyltransferase [Prolixibacteraceae bacterium]
MTKQGKLILVPTPIGNLEDITLRALTVLKEADLILAEDTRVSSKLLNHFSIEKKMFPHHKFNEHKTINTIISKLQQGNLLALIS